MNRWRRWPWTRTVLLAHLFGLVALGLAQFVVSPIDDPDSCEPASSPVERLRDWAAGGMSGDLAGEFDGHDRGRLLGSLGALIPLGGLLGWSAWSLRRSPRPRLRVATLMVLVATLALEWTAGRLVWESWGRWDTYRRQADAYAELESVYQEMTKAPVLPKDDLEPAQQQTITPEAVMGAREYGRLRQVYTRAMWCPWHEIDEAELWPKQHGSGSP